MKKVATDKELAVYENLVANLKRSTLRQASEKIGISYSYGKKLTGKYGLPECYKKAPRGHSAIAGNLSLRHLCLCGCGAIAERKGEYNAICYRKANFAIIGKEPPAYELSLDKVMQTM